MYGKINWSKQRKTNNTQFIQHFVVFRPHNAYLNSNDARVYRIEKFCMSLDNSFFVIAG